MLRLDDMILHRVFGEAFFLRRSRVLLGLLLGVLAASVAAAQSEGDDVASDPLRGWEPALAFGAGVTSQEMTGSASSDLGPSGSGGIRNDDFRSIVLRLDATLHTPVLVESSWKPRLFVRVGGERILSEEINAFAQISSFAGAAVPANCAPSLPPPARVFDACDTTIGVQVTSSGAWFAGLGLDVSQEILEQRFRLSASLDYFGQTFKANGFFRTTGRYGGNPSPPDITFNVQSYSDRFYVHGLGPQVRLSVELLELGPIATDLYIGTQLYWLLTDTEDDFRAATATNTANFSYELDEFVARGTMGFQVNWRGGM